MKVDLYTLILELFPNAVPKEAQVRIAQHEIVNSHLAIIVKLDNGDIIDFNIDISKPESMN